MFSSREKISILGVAIDSIEFSEFQSKVKECLEKGRPCFIVTPNPEFLVAAHRHASFKKLLNSADIAIPDGFGLLVAARWKGTPLQRRITGVHAMHTIMRLAAQQNKRIFLLGGGYNVAETAARVMQKKIPGLAIHGESGGVIEKKEDSWYYENANIIDAIHHFRPDVVFVGLGHEKQEQWIHDHRSQFPHVTIWMGVGGSFDYIAGNILRAPRIMRALGFEWLWRFIRQPWRIRRIFDATFYFLYLVFKERKVATHHQ